MQNGSVYNNLICKIELLNCLGHKKSNYDFLLTFRQIETAEKVLSPLEKDTLRGIIELKLLLISL